MNNEIKQKENWVIKYNNEIAWIKKQKDSMWSKEILTPSNSEGFLSDENEDEDVQSNEWYNIKLSSLIDK